MCQWPGSVPAGVGQAAVEGVDQVGGGEIAHLVTGVDGGVAKPDEGVALAGARPADDSQIMLGANPFQAR